MWENGWTTEVMSKRVQNLDLVDKLMGSKTVERDELRRRNCNPDEWSQIVKESDELERMDNIVAMNLEEHWTFGANGECLCQQDCNEVGGSDQQRQVEFGGPDYFLCQIIFVNKLRISVYPSINVLLEHLYK